MSYSVVSPIEGDSHGFITSYAPRLRAYTNTILTPVQPVVQALPNVRTTKRGTTAINYAEDGYEDEDFDSEGPRRHTGLRALRREESGIDKDAQQNSHLSKEAYAPVEVQGMWREFLTKQDRTLYDCTCAATDIICTDAVI